MSMKLAVPGAAVFAALFLLLALGATFRGAQLVLNDLEFSRLGTEVGFWGRDSYTPSQASVAATVSAIDTLVAHVPGQPDYLSLQASSLAWQAYFSTDVDKRKALNSLAMNAQLSAAQKRPAHRHSWLKVVEYASRSADGAAALKLAEQRLVLLEPDEG